MPTSNRFYTSCLVGLVLLLGIVNAYIPAVAVNDTRSLVNSDDYIHIAWLPNGVFTTGLSRQLVADSFDDDGNYTTQSPVLAYSKFSKGVLVHYNENFTSQPLSEVPWIALINCDTNGTTGTYSETDDIFTLARDHGAQSAVLYSLVAAGCLMNQDYLLNFEKVLDVYATTSMQGARLIESQFINVGGSAYDFSSQMLNNSASVISSLLNVSALSVTGGDIPNPNYNSTPTYVLSTASATSTTISSGSVSDFLEPLDSITSLFSNTLIPTSIATSSAARRRRRMIGPRAATTTAGSPTTTTSSPLPAMTIGANYLGAVLASGNVTVGGGAAPSPTATPAPVNSGPNTGLAMIILYAITGVVTFMFLVVILAGAIRAIRHPERYGPRGGNYGNGDDGQQQSRAGGLTRAILDTFPVVKFGRSTNDPPPLEEGTRSSSLDGNGKPIAMTTLNSVGTSLEGEEENEEGSNLNRQQRYEEDSLEHNLHHSSNSNSPITTRHSIAPLSTALDNSTPLPLPLTINPKDVDDGSCPICVCEFESGEDIRILPCDGRHRFHRDCIDPWLLKVSSLCPLCRLDLANGLLKEKQEEEEEAEAEQVVISNLRAMLHQGGTRMGSSNSNSNSNGNGNSGGSGSGLSNNRFFRYVASKRQSSRSEGRPDVPIDEEQ